MKRIILVFSAFFLTMVASAQDDDRHLLRGTVIYRNVPVPNENVINIATESATITDEDGRFAIAVKEGDELAFTALNYQLQVIRISAEILQKNRLVVEVDEKVTELDEVVVTPEEQERFLQVKNEELKEFEYEIDRSTEVENMALSQTERGMKDGINFVNIFKAIINSSKSDKDAEPKMKMSEVLRYVYDDEFFVADLKLPQDQIDAFLLYCDSKMPARTLLSKENEFELIDFLVTQSEMFREQLYEDK